MDKTHYENEAFDIIVSKILNTACHMQIKCTKIKRCDQNVISSYAIQRAIKVGTKTFVPRDRLVYRDV